MQNDIHNPDVNPHWIPKVGYRAYACSECGTETTIQTNHTGSCFANCAGKCRDILNPHTAREFVQWHPQRKHVFIRELEQ